ncbi:hypothetical protein P9D31_07740 [Bacillus haynesii]|uniref:beta family protein n=1 Tax=Bacillus haynesii TaxID=1925021 RepID=UPI002DBEFCD4|nr:hypothetical protein [Bacillus haynesii]MEC1472231.1 hypothetical protein [Bacillus haynesii]MEC1484616.1 hypothetical protein [Bacillus haynesii]MEC1562196.1 hypothetical protein [Bacillus haynesii]
MYYATLRQKQGECRALKALVEFKNDISQFVPNIIIKDANQESLDEIRKSYKGFVLLDVRDFEPEDIVLLEELLENDLNKDFEIMYPVEYILNNNGKEDKKYVRIDESVVNSFFIKWLNENQSSLPNRVMLDFKFIDSESSKISKFKPVLESLKKHEIIIMSGAVPQNIPVSSEENYTLRRFEKDLFKMVEDLAPNNSTLYFGDYTSVSPILSTGGRAIVQIKYTFKDNYWFVRNGLRRGNYDFVAVCKEISNTPNFDQQNCWGDSFIQSVVDENVNKGNPSVWTSIGINKHIVTCLNEI